MTRVGIIQSSYLPWRGYFDLIDSVDLFVFYDDVKYTKRDWRNRNQIVTPKDLKWLTVPIRKYKSEEIIKNIEIDESTDWRRKHLSTFKHYYASAPYFNHVIELIEKVFNSKTSNLSRLNQDLVCEFSRYLGIQTKFIDSSTLNPIGSKTGRLIDILTKLKATSYLSGPSADVYLDKKMFEFSKIELIYKSYTYEQYNQISKGLFRNASIIDLISNVGPESRQFIKSQTPDLLIATNRESG
jgi:hypothetical protein